MAIYVTSDIHGLKNRFDKMLQVLNMQENDHLYILGDVIDRGPNGISILLDCMHHKNITLLMGNHEYMMMQVLDAIPKLSQYYSMYESITYFERWFRNGCLPTIQAFEALSKDEQDAVLQYLHQLPLAIGDLQVKDRLYYLVHAKPVVSMKKGIVTLTSLIDHDVSVNEFVWDRILSYESFFEDRCVIFGHTMTSHYQKNRPYTIWSKQEKLLKSNLIGIDCGCAADDEHTQLACVCLDDMQVRYF